MPYTLCRLQIQGKEMNEWTFQFLTIYSSEQGFFLTLVGWGQSTARMASSNTVFRPRWVRAEHSRYFTASTHVNKTTHVRREGWMKGSGEGIDKKTSASKCVF